MAVQRKPTTTGENTVTEEIVLRLIIPSIPWNTLANQAIQSSIDMLAFTGWLALASISGLIYSAKREDKGKEQVLPAALLALVAIAFLGLIEKYGDMRVTSDSKFESLEKRAEQLDQIYSPEQEEEAEKEK